jgi:hypothetical protein
VLAFGNKYSPSSTSHLDKLCQQHQSMKKISTRNKRFFQKYFVCYKTYETNENTSYISAEYNFIVNTHSIIGYYRSNMLSKKSWDLKKKKIIII